MKIMMFIGPPGAGKGTQAQLLCEKYGFVSISTGQLIRNAIANGSPFGAQLKDTIAQGQLVSDELLFSILEEELKNPALNNVSVLILDGVPRNINQLYELDRRGLKIDCVVCLDLDDESVVHRLSQRWVHASSGRIYHMETHPPQNPGVDDMTGEPLSQRIDDQPETIRARLKGYHEQTEPLIDAYQNRAIENPLHLSFARFSANRSALEVFESVENTCHKCFGELMQPPI